MSIDLGPDEAFELKLIFLRELSSGHAAASKALEKLRSAPGDQQAVGELHSFFHRIAGTAETVDQALLGRLAAVCETAADALLDGSTQASKRLVQIFADGMAGVASVLEGQSGQGAARRTTAERMAVADAGAARILVVDDDPVSARLVDSVLRAAGFASTFCCDAEKAFEVIRSENPDLIILDVVMPQMDGFRLCQRVRAHPGLQLTPIIFVTRKGDLQQRVRGLQVGGNDYVAKPFEPQELVARVRSHLQRLFELREMAIRDGLTRCYNNKYFKMRLEQEIARAQRDDTCLALGMLDVDHFKKINDSYGHPAGDAVLSYLASILTASVRSTDVVARYGGEEFGFLMVEAAVPEATIIANHLRERVARHRFQLPAVGGELINLICTVSIGVAAFQLDDTVQALLQRADGALYEAKQSGRNRVWIAPPA
jgi:diguanylate cyclase (GGDEF)-like protein